MKPWCAHDHYQPGCHECSVDAFLWGPPILYPEGVPAVTTKLRLEGGPHCGTEILVDRWPNAETMTLEPEIPEHLASCESGCHITIGSALYRRLSEADTLYRYDGPVRMGPK